MIRYVVSACLAGSACRYDGTARPCPAVMALVKQGQALPLCPETLSGLPAPRPPSEWKEGRVFSRDGQDVSQAFARGAERALHKALASGAVAAILKARSPSCGVREIYDGTFSGRLIPGRGLWAQKLAEAGLELYDEEHLPDNVPD